MRRPRKLLNLRVVADRTGLGVSTIRRWASQRRIPTVRLGRRVFVDEDDLNKLIDARREPARRGLEI